MDWEVTVITQGNYIKTVNVYDYNYRPDAEEAAISQTGAIKVLHSNPVSTYSNVEEDTSKSSSSRTYYYNGGGDVPDVDLDLFEIFTAYLGLMVFIAGSFIGFWPLGVIILAIAIIHYFVRHTLKDIDLTK